MCHRHQGKLLIIMLQLSHIYKYREISTVKQPCHVEQSHHIQLDKKFNKCAFVIQYIKYYVISNDSIHLVNSITGGNATPVNLLSQGGHKVG